MSDSEQAREREPERERESARERARERESESVRVIEVERASDRERERKSERARYSCIREHSCSLNGQRGMRFRVSQEHVQLSPSIVGPYRGTSPIRKRPSPQDPLRNLGIGLRQGSRGMRLPLEQGYL